MSTTCEVPFEPLALDGSNYSAWSAHILNVLRTMGPSFERIVESSILPDDFANLFKLSIEVLKRSTCNLRVIHLLFDNIDRELSDLINKEDKLKEIRIDAHHLWKFLEAIYEENSNNEDQEDDDEESLEECTTTATHTHPLVTPPEDQGAKEDKSAGSQLEPVRPVTLTGQTGLTRNQKKKSKKCSRR